MKIERGAIEPSLNRKILENEKKLEGLFNKERINNNSSSAKKSLKSSNNHMKHRSQNFVTNYNNENSSRNKTIIGSPYSNEIQICINDNAKTCINKIESRIELKNLEIKQNKVLNKIINDIHKRVQNKRNKKIYNNIEINNIVDRLYNIKNVIEVTDQNRTIYFPIKRKNININEMLERFKEDKKKRDKEIAKKLEEKKNKEKKIYTYKPELNKLSREIGTKDKDNFLERQEKYNKKMIERKEMERQKKEREESLHKRNKKDKKENIDKAINSLLEWDMQRKKKIENKQKQKKEQEETKFDYIPKINKKSKSIVKRNKNKFGLDVVSRLALDDKLLKEKKRALEELYAPSFRPNSVAKKREKSMLSFYDSNKLTKRTIRRNEREIEEESKIEFENYNDDLVQNAFRKTFLKKIKKFN